MWEGGGRGGALHGGLGPPGPPAAGIPALIVYAHSQQLPGLTRSSRNHKLQEDEDPASLLTLPLQSPQARPREASSTHALPRARMRHFCSAP